MPRWQIGLHWRTDGEPLWTDDALLADPWPTGRRSRPSTAPTDVRAGSSCSAPSPTASGCRATQVRPAYEDR